MSKIGHYMRAISSKQIFGHFTNKKWPKIGQKPVFCKMLARVGFLTPIQKSSAGVIVVGISKKIGRSSIRLKVGAVRPFSKFQKSIFWPKIGKKSTFCKNNAWDRSQNRFWRVFWRERTKKYYGVLFFRSKNFSKIFTSGALLA